MRIALYARVSKGIFQNPENQLIALRQWAKNSNAEIIGEFVDEISSRKSRPQKELLLRKLRLKEIDGVAFYALDRWGRSLPELVDELKEVSVRNWTFISLKEGLSFDTASGRMFANMLAVFADFERDRIQERTNSGVERARAWGKIPGRHPIECGCGIEDKDGKKHEGKIKPIRDQHNRFIGWDGLDRKSKQTPSK